MSRRPKRNFGTTILAILLIVALLVPSFGNLSIASEETFNEYDAQSNKEVYTKTWNFSDATQLKDFDLYQPQNLSVTDGILKTAGRMVGTKAMIKTPFEGGSVKSVSVDIIPGDATKGRPIDAAILLGASEVDTNEATMKTPLTFNVESHWSSDPNKIDLIPGSFTPAWKQVASRLTSNEASRNALYSNGQRKPLNLKLDIHADKVVATLSLVDNPNKFVQLTYSCDTSTIAGQIGLRAMNSDVSFDNLKITYLKTTYSKVWDFSDASQISDFNLYQSQNLSVTDGILKTAGRMVGTKAMVKTPFKGENIKSVSVDIIPGDASKGRPVDAAILLGASDVDTNEATMKTPLTFNVESHWSSDPNKIDLIPGSFTPAWKQLASRVTSNEANGNALYSDGERKPLNLKLDFYTDKVVATLSLVDNPSKFVKLTYACDPSTVSGQIGLRAMNSDVSFDNLKIEYLQEAVVFNNDYRTIRGTLSDYGLTAGFTVQNGRLVPPTANGEGKALLKEAMSDYETVSVDIYPSNNKINSAIYLGALGASDEADSINAVAVSVESRSSTDPSQIAVLIGGFPTWQQYHRKNFTGEESLFADGEKKPINLKIDIDGKNLTVTISLLDDPQKTVTTTYEYTGNLDLKAGRVGLRAQYNDSSFDNFKVKSSQREKTITFDSTTDLTAFDCYHSIYGDGVKTIANNTLALHNIASLQAGTLSVEVNTGGAHKDAGIVFGADKDAKNYYLYRLTAQKNVELVKVENGTETVLDTGFLSGAHIASDFQRLEVVKNGNQICCYYYNMYDTAKCYAVYEDENPLSGTGVGIWSGTSGVAFRNLSISDNKDMRQSDVLIFGHSYTEMWDDYKDYFPEYKSIDNIGISGSIAEHWEELTDEIVAYEPKLGIYNIGINDVSRGVKPKTVVESIERTILAVKEEVPEFEVVLVSVSHCPSCQKLTKQITETNIMMRILASSYDWVHYAEAEYLFCTDKTDPTSTDAKYFLSDGLHPSAAGYQLMAECIKDAIESSDGVSIATWDFSNATQLADFDLYQSQNLSVTGGILKTAGRLVGTKAMVKTPYEGSVLKTVSVDIIPGDASKGRPVDAAILLGASEVDTDEKTMKAPLTFNVESHWSSDANKIDLIPGSFTPAWKQLASRVTSNGANNNALYSNGERKPLNLKLDFYTDKVVATLSLVDNPDKFVQLTYPCDPSTITGQIGLRAMNSDVSFDNLTIICVNSEEQDNSEVFTDKKALEQAIEAAEALNEEDYSADSWTVFQKVFDKAKEVFADKYAIQRQVDEALNNLNKAMEELPLHTRIYTFDDMKELWDFDFYHSSQGYTLSDGTLTSRDAKGESKAILKGNNRAYKKLSVDVYPGDEGGINAGFYIYAAGAGHVQDKIHGIYVGLQSNYSGWADAPNRVDILVGTFPTWKQLSKTISEGGKGNAIFRNGEKQPVNLQLDIEQNVLTVRVSLLSDPDTYVQTVYEYTGEGNLEHGQVGLRAHWAKNSFDNFIVQYADEEYDQYAIPGAVMPVAEEDDGIDLNIGKVTENQVTSTDNNTSPETGDSNGSVITVAVTMLVVSLGTILFLFYRKRKQC